MLAKWATGINPNNQKYSWETTSVVTWQIDGLKQDSGLSSVSAMALLMFCDKTLISTRGPQPTLVERNSLHSLQQQVCNCQSQISQLMLDNLLE